LTVLVTIVLGLVALLAIEYTQQALFAAMFLVTAFAAVLVKNLDLRWLGVETATFGTFILAMVSSPLKAGLIGFVLISIQMIARQQFGPYILWVIPSYALMGTAVSIIQPTNVFIAGVTTTIALHTIFTAFTWMRTPEALSNYMPYAVLNIAFNALLFKLLASPILQIV
jgi:hypothetical protein